MACGCGKRNPRPAWQPRGARKAEDASKSGAGARIVPSEERAAELANGRPARARQPGSR